MQQLQWLSGCMKDKRKWFWLAMALAVVSAGLCVVFPFITQQITCLLYTSPSPRD